MTKPFSTALLALFFIGMGHASPAQTISTGEVVPFWPLDAALAEADANLTGDHVPPTSEFPMPWMFRFGDAQPITDPVVLERSIGIAIREGILGAEVAPYQTALPGPGYAALIPAPVPEGWVVTSQCMAWDEAFADAENPEGPCYIYEMRKLLSDETSVAWD